MDERRNNLGRQYTNDPHFGTVYPNTQYKGYADGEKAPFGGPSNPQQSRPANLNNVRLHGGSGSGPNTLRSQYNPDLQGGNQYRDLVTWQENTNQLQAAGNLRASSNQPDLRSTYQGLGHYQSAGNQYQNNTYQGAAYQENVQTMQQTPQYNDRDRITDLLNSEKHLTELYNISAFEASNPQLQNTLMGLLNETHNNRELLNRTMEERGWYKSEPADQQMIAKTYNQFSNSKNQLPF